MKEQFVNIPLVKDDDKKRFEIELDGHFAFKESNHRVALIHTEAAPELAGTGAAAAVEKTFHWIEEQGKMLLPYCPYVFAYLKRHPEWKRIVDKKFNGYDKL